jgi:hypothetical protein
MCPLRWRSFVVVSKKKLVVRRDVSLDSAKVGTLLPNQVVDCVRQQQVDGRIRCCVFLGTQEGYGWISATGSDGVALIQQHGSPMGAATPVGVEGGGGRTVGNGLMIWRRVILWRLGYAFDALYDGIRMLRRHRRLRVTFDAWVDLRLGRATAGSFSARMVSRMEEQQAQPQAQPQPALRRPKANDKGVPKLTLQPLSPSLIGSAGSRTSSLGPSDASGELFPDGVPAMQSKAQVEIVAPGSPEAQTALLQEVALLRQKNDALHQDLVR